MELHGTICFQAWNRMEPYGFKHGIAWNHIFSSMELHGAICFQAWNRMEPYDS